MLFPLIYITLFLQLGSLSSSSEQMAVELEIRRREVKFIHFALDRTALRDLRVWDSKSDVLRDARPGEVIDDSTEVMILHLWATWCGPCKEEFPLWRQIEPSILYPHKGRVRIAHVALQSDSTGMANFVKEMAGQLPFPLEHFDRNSRLADKLNLVDKQLALPVTLLLDSERVVRQAFIGSIRNRREELIESTGRLVRLIKTQQALGRVAPSDPRSAKHPSPAAKPAASSTVKIYGID